MSRRPPPHLKGKAIGMFYARLNKEKRQKLGLGPKERDPKNQPIRPLGTVLLSEETRQGIQSLVQQAPFYLTANDGSYDHIEDSSFKREFLNVIQGTIQERMTETKSLAPDKSLDESLYEELQHAKTSNTKYIHMQKGRKRLPSYAKKDEIIELIQENQVVLISGETGCGKTTQVAQLILDDEIETKNGSMCNIICTQPRRISAISIAERVADERGERLGQSVGYQIRLEKRMPRSRGGITYCTTGVVQKLMETDPCLSRFSHIILDEIHERNIVSDFLIALLKNVINKRKDIKVILMSATLNADKFAYYYDNCPHLNIPGFTYPVQEYYLEDVLQRTGFQYGRAIADKNDHSTFIGPHIRKLEADRKYSRDVCAQLWNPATEQINLDLVLALLINICRSAKDTGAILVFVTGFSEISTLNGLIERSGRFPAKDYLIIPLHSQMTTVGQRQVFERPPNGVRKIVISTNIAETSITIDDVVFVIDCGKIKMTNFTVETQTQTLLPEWVSLANAAQRKGRAGRVQPGVCFHLWTKARDMLLEQYPKPEILRTRLEGTILTIKILRLGKAQHFLDQLLDRPDPEAVNVALELLRRINALDADENLTPLGFHLAKLPVAPQMGKMMLLGAIFSCLDPVLSIAACMDFKDPFLLPLGKEKQVDARKKELANGNKSDHLLLYKIMKAYESCPTYETSSYCWRNFLSSRTLSQLSEMKKQFAMYLEEMNFVSSRDPMAAESNINSHNMSLVKAIICAGLYPNVARAYPAGKRQRYRIVEGPTVKLVPGSVVNDEICESHLLVYHYKQQSSSLFLHGVSMVFPLPILFFGEEWTTHLGDNNQHLVQVSPYIRFKITERSAAVIKDLRDKLNSFLEYKVAHPEYTVNWMEDGANVKILRAIMELITNEDVGNVDLEAYDDC